MSESADQKKPRGEAAWLAHRAAIEERNAAASKEGKARHDAAAQVRESNRRATDAREERRFLSGRETP